MLAGVDRQFEGRAIRFGILPSLVLACIVFACTGAVVAQEGSAIQALDLSQIVRSANEVFEQLEQRESQEPDHTQVEQINSLIDQVEQRDPGSAWLDYLYGRAYAVTSRPGDAIDRLRRFVETPQGRNDWVSYRVLGDLFIAEFPRLARSNYLKAAELHAGQPSILFGLSRSAARLGDMQGAVALGQQAVDGDGKQNSRYLSHLALLFASQKKWDQALGVAEPALVLKNELLEANPGELALLQAVERQYRVLFSVIEAQINEVGEHPEGAYLRLAQVVREKAQLNWRLSFHEEVGVLERALGDGSVEPSADLLERYGTALVMIGRTAEAIEAFQKLLQHDPNHPVATRWLKRLANSERPIGGAPPSPSSQIP